MAFFNAKILSTVEKVAIPLLDKRTLTKIILYTGCLPNHGSHFP